VAQELVVRSVHQCHHNHTVDRDEQFSSSCEIMTMGTALAGHSIQEYMDEFSVPLSGTCPECNN